MPRIQSADDARRVSLIGQARRSQKRQYPLPTDVNVVSEYCRKVDPTGTLTLVERLQRASYLWQADQLAASSHPSTPDDAA